MTSGTTKANATSEDKHDEVSDPVADLMAAVEVMNVNIIKFVSEFKQTIRKANPDSDPSKNFTWEICFTAHCGILPDDARKYEKDLIAHRWIPWILCLGLWG